MFCSIIISTTLSSTFGVSGNLHVPILGYRHVNLSACCLCMSRFSHLRLVGAGRLGIDAEGGSRKATLIPDLDVEEFDVGIAAGTSYSSVSEPELLMLSI